MNAGEGKSTSTYTDTATASKISYYYSVSDPEITVGKFRMSNNSGTSYSGTRKGTDKSNKIIRERLLCKDTPNRWRLVRLGGGQGQLRQDMRKLCKITGHGAHRWRAIHPVTAARGNRAYPGKAMRGEPDTSKKEVVLAATLKNSHGKQSISRLKTVWDKLMKARSTSEWSRCDASWERSTATLCWCAEGPAPGQGTLLNTPSGTATLHPTIAVPVQRTHAET